ncbi:RecA protein [Acidisarcina polymorpha]|uniref:Protein RecA n=1 Tax=Acidisarcina polymorpha TaxID=2211140 RepID=A0A2Z5G850_9BACT|nr:RecA protein [Acidisarcina polymorpha]
MTPVSRIIRTVAATGISAVDELLDGGLQVGAITEIVGPECSGRTSLALAFLAQMTSVGRVCAWVDVSDTLHPESAAAAGIDLDHLLWVRCGGPGTQSLSKTHDPQPLMTATQTTRVQLGGNSPHPRTESKGLPTAISDLLGAKVKYRRDRITGTPGAPNRPLSSIAEVRHDVQVASDRLPARRGSYVLLQREAYEPRCAEPQRKQRPQKKNIERVGVTPETKNRYTSSLVKPWARLDQALRVTDLLLQAGGFSAVVLDMGSIGGEYALRVPLATWFRYRAAAERTQCSLLLLTQLPCAKSSAGTLLHLDAATPIEEGATVFAGFTNHIELSRRRFDQQSENVVPIRKPPQRSNAAEWRNQTTWAGMR